ncbi:MAG: DUF86 domain-containing protein [Deltaproteobacteria bacterium]|nr:DUF86 domain-containing protein [Deltaproteobacteria bacterium]MBW1995773.1 DUF86 domain-containing protein [Deltaproteobacteria bacterium]
MKSIDKKIGILKERIRRLKALEKTVPTFEKYQKLLNTKDIAERNLQVAIEACLDISKIIISNSDLPEPEDNKGVFRVLAEAGIIDEECLKFLIPMAGTRNILVHGYDQIDDAIVYGVLKKRLDDFELFLKNIVKNYIHKQKEISQTDGK